MTNPCTTYFLNQQTLRDLQEWGDKATLGKRNMYEVLTVLNCCGASGRENFKQYERALDSLLAQQGVTQRVMVSGYKLADATKTALHEKYGGRVSFVFIEPSEQVPKVPVNISFNHAVSIALDNYNFEAVIYVDSGVNCVTPTDLKRLWELYRNNNDYSMVAAKCDDDFFVLDGWYPTDPTVSTPPDKGFVVDHGKAVNLHCQLFGLELLNDFPHLIPDIFWAHCTEGTFTNLARAIGTHLVIHPTVLVHHEKSVDGASTDFPSRGKAPWQELFTDKRSVVRDILSDPRAYSSGFAYEVCQGVFPPNMEAINTEGFAKTTLLRDFCREALFLREDEFSYGSINAEYYP